jgi:hypothetical protein
MKVRICKHTYARNKMVEAWAIETQAFVLYFKTFELAWMKLFGVKPYAQ